MGKKRVETKVPPRSTARYIVGALGLILLFLLPLYGRCLYEAHTGVTEGDEARSRAETRPAIDAYARAVRWRGVLNPFSQGAIEKLTSLSRSLNGEDKVYALKELRRALFVSRSFYTNESGDQELIAAVTSELEQLGARKKSVVTLEKPFVVSYANQLMAQAAFWGWIGSVLVLISRGITPEGKMGAGSKILLPLISLGFFVAWVLVLWVG